MSAEEFRKTRNPVLAIEVMIRAHHEQIPCPPTICAAFIDWLEQWHANQGTVSLDKIIGLKVSNGKTPPYKALLLQDRNVMLFHKIAVLKAIGVKTSRAAEIACRGFEMVKDWNQSKWQLSPIDADTAMREYSKWPDRKETEALFKELVPKWSPKEMHGFLSQFPSDCLTLKLKDVLRKLSDYRKRNEPKWRRVPPDKLDPFNDLKMG
jgi:hypothetical protein